MTAPSLSALFLPTTGEARSGGRWNGMDRQEATLDAIFGVFADKDTKDAEFICIQCVNRKSLTFAKAAKDIAKVLKADNGTPHYFRIVARSNISAECADKIKKHVKSLGVHECDIWSGAEFEEFLRQGAESLLKRFVEGEAFPDAPEDLRKLAECTQPFNDDRDPCFIRKAF